MTVSPRSFRIAALSCTAVLSLLNPASAEAIEGSSSSSLVDRRSENRIEVVVDGTGAEVRQIPLGDQFGKDVMAFRFRLEAVNKFGATIAMPASIVLTMRVGALSANSEVRFTRDLSDLTLPRPWAIRLGADDSLVVSLAGSETANDEISFRLSIDYEPLDRVQSRRAVNTMETDSRTSEVGLVEAWDWRPTTDGRLLAMTGLSLDRIDAIALVDVETGAILWSTDVSGHKVGGSASASAVLRLGVPVTAGRSYRLTVTYSATALDAMTSRAVVAMVLPSTVGSSSPSVR